jgi:hypothetical protein
LKIKTIYFILSCKRIVASKRIESMCDIYLYSKQTSSSLCRVPFQRSSAARARGTGDIKETSSSSVTSLWQGGKAIEWWTLKELNTSRPGNSRILLKKEEGQT